jgi:hypothetical protein
LPASQLQHDTIISISITLLAFRRRHYEAMKTLRHAEPRQIRHYCFRHYAITPATMPTLPAIFIYFHCHGHYIG